MMTSDVLKANISEVRLPYVRARWRSGRILDPVQVLARTQTQLPSISDLDAIEHAPVGRGDPPNREFEAFGQSLARAANGGGQLVGARSLFRTGHSPGRRAQGSSIAVRTVSLS